MKHYFAIFYFILKLSRNYELRSRTQQKIVKRKKGFCFVLFLTCFFPFQNVDKICYGRHIICTDGRVTGNKTLFLFGLIIWSLKRNNIAQSDFHHGSTQISVPFTLFLRASTIRSSFSALTCVLCSSCSRCRHSSCLL